MSNFTIGGKKVDNADAQKALEKLSKHKDFQKYFKDQDLTESELGTILDVDKPNANIINVTDSTVHTLIDETMTDDEFDALAREYNQRFPDGKKKVDKLLFATIDELINFKRPSLDTSKTITLYKAIQQILMHSDFIFIGDSHGVDDESIFRNKEMLVKLHKQFGVKSLAVELGTDQQKALDLFLKKGDASKFNDPYDKIIKHEPGLVKLMKMAHDVGIKIVCVDQPLKDQSDPAKREQFIADKLKSLNGKTLVWLGSAHGALDTKPYKTARSILQESGRPTAGIKLESQAAIDVARSLGIVGASILHSAYSEYFTNKQPSTPIAYPTSELGTMRYLDPTPSRIHGEHLLYSQSYDFVFFLPKSSSANLMRLHIANKP